MPYLPDGSSPSLGVDPNDPAVAYFTQKAGRPPTPEEAAAYSGQPNFQAQIDANVAAPNGYYNLITYGNVNGQGGAPSASSGAPGEIPGYGQAPAPYRSAVQAPNYQAPNLAAIPQYKAPDPFVAPTLAAAMNAPGVQVGAHLATDAAQNSAAAQGSVLGGGFQKALAQYLQDYGTTKYGDVLGQAESVYGLNANTQLGAYNANTGATLASNQQQLGASNQTFQNQYQSFGGQNAANLNDYLTNYGTSHQAANDYYNAILDQQKLGAGAASTQVTA